MELLRVGSGFDEPFETLRGGGGVAGGVEREKINVPGGKKEKKKETKCQRFQQRLREDLGTFC